MRPLVALIAANLLFAGTGAAVLFGLGVVRLRVGELLAAGGLAVMTGVAAGTIAQIFLLVLGVDVRFQLAVALCLLVGAAGLAAGLLRARRGEPVRPAPPTDDGVLLGPGGATAAGASAPVPATAAGTPAWRRVPGFAGGRTDRVVVALAALAAAIVIAIFFVRSIQGYDDTPVLNFDEFAIWSKKAFAFFYLGGLDPAFFANPSLNPIHLEYPILLPVLEAFMFRGFGRLDVGMVHVELFVLLVATVWAAGWIAARDRRNWLWLPIPLLLLVSPFAEVQQMSGLADILMASFAMLGVLSLGQWLEHDHRGFLLLGALLLGASSNTKVEGLLAAGAALGVLLVIVLVRREFRRIVPLVMAGIVLAVLVLPWRIWVAAHPAINTFFDFKQALDPGFLIDHLSLVHGGWAQLDVTFGEPVNMLFLVPLALAILVTAIVTGVDRPLAIFYLAVPVAFVVAVLWIYIVNPATWSAGRVISGPAMVAIAGLLHVGARVAVGRAPGAAALGEEEAEPATEHRVEAARI
jgi:hypothetical protein